MFRNSHKGFTLIELLVAMAIIAVLIALLLPAVQQAREAARRTDCKNRMRQIGLALHNYHDTHQTFPSGEISSSTSCPPAGSAARRSPWSVMILPFLDESPRYHRFQFDKQFAGIANEVTTNPNEPEQIRPLAKFQCPTDPNSTPAEPNSNYRAVQGGGPQSAARCAPSNRVLFENGLMFQNSKVAIRDVTDGSSNTLMVGESRWWFARGKNSPFGIGGTGTYFTWASTVRNADAATHTNMTTELVEPINLAIDDYDPSNGPYGANYNLGNIVKTHTRTFGSWHVGGCHFVLADGSVRFINEYAHTQTLQQAAQRDDGLSLGGIP